ncbi:hypothetical protein BOX15_Mlig008296g1 [Macrostomum lignano]|uniref:PEST proteolytic signal-containing nuclear protein n=1 Tax=Macrostomum lignano TaxID=282301 RepID=A0A267FDS1_9PLAT|nr:hypothetical protein BOX15_Mlig008296g1 [Macrostomum lignano]
MWNPSAVPAAATFGSTAGVSAQQSPGQAAAASIAVSTPSFSHYAALAAAYSSAAASVPIVPAPVQAPKRPSDLKNVNTSTMCRFNLGNGAPTGVPPPQQPPALPQTAPTAAGAPQPLPEAHSNVGDDDESAFEAEFDRIMEAKRQAEEANLDPDERAALRELEAVKKQRRFANPADSTEADAAREFDRFQTSSASDSTGDGSELAKQAAEWRTYMSYALQYNPQEAERLFAMYPHLRDLLATPDDAFKQQQTALAAEQTKQPMAPNFNVTSYEIQQQQQPMQPPIQPQQQPQQQHLPTLPTMAEAESRRKAQEAAEQALIELAAMQEQQQEQQKQQQQQLEQQQQKQLLKQQQKQQREQQAQLKASSKKSSGFHDVSQPPPQPPPHQQQQQKQQREQQAQLKASSKKSSGFHDISQPPPQPPPHQQKQHPPRPWADTDERKGRQQQPAAPAYKKSRFDSPQPWQQQQQKPPPNFQQQQYQNPPPHHSKPQHHASNVKRQNQQRSGVVINFGQRPAESSNLVPVQDASVRQAFAAAADEGDEAEEGEVSEEVPDLVRIRMRNVGKYTPTSEGPRSYGKTRAGFCDDRRRPRYERF